MLAHGLASRPGTQHKNDAPLHPSLPLFVPKESSVLSSFLMSWNVLSRKVRKVLSVNSPPPSHRLTCSLILVPWCSRQWPQMPGFGEPRSRLKALLCGRKNLSLGIPLLYTGVSALSNQVITKSSFSVWLLSPLGALKILLPMLPHKHLN